MITETKERPCIFFLTVSPATLRTYDGRLKAISQDEIVFKTETFNLENQVCFLHWSAMASYAIVIARIEQCIHGTLFLNESDWDSDRTPFENEHN